MASSNKRQNPHTHRNSRPKPRSALAHRPYVCLAITARSILLHFGSLNVAYNTNQIEWWWMEMRCDLVAGWWSSWWWWRWSARSDSADHPCTFFALQHHTSSEPHNLVQIKHLVGYRRLDFDVSLSLTRSGCLCFGANARYWLCLIRCLRRCVWFR